jgi:Fic family protein
MNYGLARLKTLPLSLCLIREIHAKLLSGVRGSMDAGEFRDKQNWIGPPGCVLKDAKYVPPAPHDMHQGLDSLEKFLHDTTPLPYLVRTGIAHAYFETIHPFFDGNGRLGRLLITFMLCEEKILRRPLLYLSVFLKKNRTEYYDRLQAVRDSGQWEEWLTFFLRGVAEVAEEATTTARKNRPTAGTTSENCAGHNGKGHKQSTESIGESLSPAGSFTIANQRRL